MTVLFFFRYIRYSVTSSIIGMFQRYTLIFASLHIIIPADLAAAKSQSMG